MASLVVWPCSLDEVDADAEEGERERELLLRTASPDQTRERQLGRWTVFQLVCHRHTVRTVSTSSLVFPTEREDERTFNHSTIRCPLGLTLLLSMLNVGLQSIDRPIPGPGPDPDLPASTGTGRPTTVRRTCPSGSWHRAVLYGSPGYQH